MASSWWPSTEAEFTRFDNVANGALAEVGLGDRYRLYMEVNGNVGCNPPAADIGDEDLIDRAVNLAWEAARRVGDSDGTRETAEGPTR